MSTNKGKERDEREYFSKDEGSQYSLHGILPPLGATARTNRRAKLSRCVISPFNPRYRFVFSTPKIFCIDKNIFVFFFKREMQKIDNTLFRFMSHTMCHVMYQCPLPHGLVFSGYCMENSLSQPLLLLTNKSIYCYFHVSYNCIVFLVAGSGFGSRIWCF